MSVDVVRALFHWLGASPLGHFMRDYAPPSTIAVVAHLFGLILLGGPALLVALASVGCVVRSPSPARLDGELWPFFLSGVALTFVSGVALVSAKADVYYEDRVFWVKLTLLALALVVSLALHHRLRRLGEAPVPAPWRLAGTTQLLLWLGVAVAGRGIGLL